MFDKLKSAVGDAALKKAVDELGPIIEEKLTTVSALAPAVVADDIQFKSSFVEPTLLAIKAASSGAVALIPKFDERFGRAMVHLRDELIVIDPNKSTVSLVPDLASRLPAVLVEGLKVAAA